MTSDPNFKIEASPGTSKLVTMSDLDFEIKSSPGISKLVTWSDLILKSKQDGNLKVGKSNLSTEGISLDDGNDIGSQF